MAILRRRWVGAIPLCLQFVLSFACAVEAQEVAFGWQPGFPMRAGAQVLLMWNPYAGAEGYSVVRKAVRTGQQETWPTAATQFIDASAAESESYAYTIQVVLPGGARGPTSEVRNLSASTPLEPPKWIGVFQSGKAVNLAWERAERAAFYNVYRSEGDGPPSLLTSVQDSKHVDATVRPGIRYGYRLRAVGTDSRESRDSERREVSLAVSGDVSGEERTERRWVQVVGKIRADSKYRLREPTDLAFSRGSLFVTDLGSRSVLTLGVDGTFLYSFGQKPVDYTGVWGIPWGIDVSSSGDRVALTFMQSPVVRLFTREGKLVADFKVNRPKGFEDRPEVPQPMDVAFDEDGSLWTSDYTYGQLLHLGVDGKELGRVGNPRFSKEPGPFRSPTFVAARPGGGVFATDSLLAEVFESNGSGEIVRRWRRTKGDDGVLNLPKGLALTVGGQLLVVDGLRSTLQSFTQEGKLEAVYAVKNKKTLELSGLVSVSVDPKSGEIYALSKVDSTVYRFVVTEVETPRK